MSDQTFTKDAAISTLTTGNTGGMVATWSISPTLPDGLSFSNGIITGTPTANQTASSYTITAVNTGGTATVSFDITINEAVAVLTMADQTFTKDAAISTLTTGNTGGVVATWSISPTLPDGLSFSNGVITGTPTANQTASSYTLSLIHI